jgi:hypothetical protein
MLMNGLKGQLRVCRDIWSYRVRGRLLVWKVGRMGEGVALRCGWCDDSLMQ